MHRCVEKLARTFALIGGGVLTFLIILTCASVLGRTINSILHSDLIQTAMPDLAAIMLATGIGPINGDYEIVEAGMAFAIFAFLPICQLHGSHASVDVFTSKLPQRFNRALRMVIELAFAAVLITFAWQLSLGGLSKYNSGQTTFLLEFPVWWSYAASILAAWVAALVGVYVALARTREGITGQPGPLHDDGAGH